MLLGLRSRCKMPAACAVSSVLTTGSMIGGTVSLRLAHAGPNGAVLLRARRTKTRYTGRVRPRRPFWIALAAAVGAGGCSGGYPLPPTRCDEWCDATKAGACVNYYDPAG